MSVCCLGCRGIAVPSAVFELHWNIDTPVEEKILTLSSLEPLEGLPQWSWGSFKVPSKSNPFHDLEMCSLAAQKPSKNLSETSVLVPVCVFIVVCYKSIEF